MNAQHTPGPWRVVAGAEIHADRERIVEFHSITDIPGDRIDANARLIAAAPELLAALEVVIEDYYHQAGIASLTPDSGSRLLYENARAAIAKALPPSDNT